MALDTGKSLAAEFKSREQLLNDAAADLDYGDAILMDRSYEDVYGKEGAQQRAAAAALLGIGKILLAQEKRER